MYLIRRCVGVWTRQAASSSTPMSSKIEKSTSAEAKNAVVDVDAQTNDEGEVFQTDVEGQNYRTVSWLVDRSRDEDQTDYQVSHFRSHVQSPVLRWGLVNSRRIRLCRRRPRCTIGHRMGQLQHLCRISPWFFQAKAPQYSCESAPE
jgi:hypothetical protein